MFAVRTSHELNSTLWVRGVEAWMDEAYLAHAFAPAGVVTNVRLVRDRHTGLPLSYAFVEFETHENAARLMEQVRSKPFVSIDGHRFNLDWATGGPGGGHDTTVFVGNLDFQLQDEELLECFAARFRSVTSAKVIWDLAKAKSKGFGFVRFRDPAEADKAQLMMEGVLLGGKPMRVRPADKHQNKQADGAASQDTCFSTFGLSAPAVAPEPPPPPPLVPKGHCVQFTGLDLAAQEMDMKRYFRAYGTVIRVLMFAGQGCGVVEFHDRESADKAVLHLQGDGHKQARHISTAEVYALTSGAAAPPMNPQPPPPPCPAEGSAPLVGPPPAVTNMTAADAQTKHTQLQQQGYCYAPMMPMGHGATAAPTFGAGVPSIEHFQVLLQDPCFVQAFEQQLERQLQGAPATSGEPAAVPPESSWLLSDTPSLFGGGDCGQQMNASFLATPGCPRVCRRSFPSMAFAPPHSSTADVPA